MELFERTLSDIRNYTVKRNYESWVATEIGKNWPKGKGRNVVLADDTAVEMGSPQMDSVAHTRL